MQISATKKQTYLIAIILTIKTSYNEDVFSFPPTW